MKEIVKRFCVFLLGFVAIGSAQTSIQAPTSFTGAGKNVSLLEAVQSTLAHHPLLRSQEAQVEISRGAAELAAGQFDAVMQGGFGQDWLTTPLTAGQEDQNAAAGILSNKQSSQLTNYGIYATRQFRNGVSIRPGIQLSRSTDNLFNTTGNNTSSTSLLINVPLLRGRGSKVVAAQENAALTEIDASLYDLNQLIAQLMSSTAASYWNLVAASKSLAIARESEARGRIFLENVQALVAADHAPRNDLNEAMANLDQRISNRIASEQVMLAAQEQLALDMGVGSDRIIALIPEPTDDFPAAEEQPLLSDSPEALQYYLEQALSNRADYLASRQRITGSQILATAAQNKLLPQLNLNLQAGYSGLQEGGNMNNFFAASLAGVRGPNTTIGFTYSFPGKNRAGHGAARQAQAQLEQTQMQSRETARNISAQLVTAVGAVRSAVLRAKNARESVEAYRAALNGEKEKYKAGMGSIVNVLTVEDKLTGSMSDQVQAQLAYALALTQFRFDTGMLISPNKPVQHVEPDTFVSLPFLGAPKEHP
jgi:outer membrane protein TolC